MKQAVLLIGPQLDIVERALAADFAVLIVQRKKDINSALVQLAEATFVVEWRQDTYMLDLARTIYVYRPFIGAFGFGEASVYTAALINNALRLKLNPLSAVAIAKNKILMRQTLEKYDFSPVRYHCCLSRSDLLALPHHLPFPLILKPFDGTASAYIHKLPSPEELQAYVQKIPDGQLPHVLLAEEFLGGNEVSVEALSFEGSHHIVAITQKYTTGSPSFIETGHMIPVQLSAQTQREITDFTTHLLDSIGQTFGPSHTEIKLTPQGLRVVETHTRPGGGKITDLVQLSYGIDLLQATFHCLHGSLPTLQPSYRKHSAVRFIFLPQGTIKDIQGLETIKKHPNVLEVDFHYQRGDFVTAVTDSFTRHGSILFSAENAATLQQAIREVMDTLHVLVEG